MTIAEIIKKVGSEYGSSDDLKLAADVLLAHVLNKTGEELFMNYGCEVEERDERRFWECLSRHYRGEPVAYLINNKQFFGLDFYVDKNVLIPRPETEILVEKVLDFAKKCEAEDDIGLLSVLDVGTGCGNIAVSLAKNIQDVHVTAVDISAEALEVAKKNALTHGVFSKVDFMVSDLLCNVHGEFDVLVVNLPYIGIEKCNFVSKEAYDYEPHVALFGGTDGLGLYEDLFKQIKEKNMNPALILGEFGFLQAEKMSELLAKYFGFVNFVIEKDLASIERVFMIKSC